MRSKNNLSYIIEDILPVPEVFQFVEEQSKTSTADMIKIFNYGLGLVIFVEDQEAADQVIKIVKKHDLNAITGGYLEQSKSNRREVVIKPLKIVLESESFLLEQ